MNSLPEDLSEWLIELNLSDCVTSLQKNMVLAFVDGTLIANIIHRTFPRLILLQSYEETSNVSKRTTNWQLLNRKVLNVLQCELGNEDISKIVSRNIQRGAIIIFLRLLRTKLEAYQSVYDKKQRKLAQEQKFKRDNFKTIIDKQQEKKRASVHKTLEEMNLENTGTPSIDPNGNGNSVKSRAPSAVSTSGANRKTSINTTATSKSRKSSSSTRSSSSLYKSDRKEFEKGFPTMSESEMDAMYEYAVEVSIQKGTLNQDKINQMESKSLKFEEMMMKLRDQNTADLNKIEANLNKIKAMPIHVDMGVDLPGSSVAGEAHEDLNASGEFGNPISGIGESNNNIFGFVENVEDKEFLGMTKRSSAISRQIVDMLPVEVRETTRKSFIRASMIQNQQDAEKDADDYNYMGDRGYGDDKDDDACSDGGYNGDGGGDGEYEDTQEEHQEERQEEHQEEHQEDDDNVKLYDYSRVFDVNSQQHYYVDENTGESSWVLPTAGIIKCDDSGKTFYTNAETQVTGWAIEEVL